MWSPEKLRPAQNIAIQQNFDAQKAFEIMADFHKNIYMPFRGQQGYGTERSTLMHLPHVEHMENDAEHSWDIEGLVKIYWHNREQLNLEFEPGYDPALANDFAHAHDLAEIVSRDVDATTEDQSLVIGKAEREYAAMLEIEMKHPYMRGIAATWKKYERKDTPEAQFVSDIDKIAGTHLICMDGGRKWHGGMTGYTVTQERMVRIMRAKLLTPFGHKMHDELEAHLDQHPEYFPLQDKPQGTLFDYSTL